MAPLSAPFRRGLTGLLAAAGLVAGAPPELLVLGARIPGQAGLRGVAVREGRILELGPDARMRRLAGRGTRVLEAQGATLLPGFQDAHVHLQSGGLGLKGLALGSATRAGEILEALRRWDREHPGEGWIQGRGWTYTCFPGGLPDKALLDGVVKDRPVYLRAFDGHTAWANSRALALAGITAATPDPAGGQIVRDPRSGEPTGILKEEAQELMKRVIPPPSRAERLEALRAAMREAHRVGVTAVQEAGATAEEVELFEALRASGELKLRTYLALTTAEPLTDGELARMEALRARHREDPVLRVGAVKLFIDGVIESGTARLLAPYAVSASRGEALMDQAALNTRIATLDRHGWQVWVHAIGDGGVRMVLDAVEAAGPGARARRHRVEHGELIDPADLPRFAALGVVASQQPLHGSPESLGPWKAQLGAPRAERGWRFGSLLRSGARLAFGSDWPVVGMDPLPALHMATTRTSPDGQPAGGWLPAERLSLREALDAFTTGAAYAAFDEARSGRLAPGMVADLVLLDRDLERPGALRKAKVAFTVFDGKVVYQAR
jgi:predicted amidohydrolase YtcJ